MEIVNSFSEIENSLLFPSSETYLDANRVKDKFQAVVNDKIKDSLLLGEALSFNKLKILTNEIQANSIATNSPYFMNQLFSGIFPQTLLAEEILAKTKTTLATFEASPIFTQIEQEVIAKLCAQINWDQQTGSGIAVPGGSAANFMAVHLAKHKLFPETKRQGLGNRTFRIFVSKDAHYSFKKAALALGMGTDSIVEVATDLQGKICIESLEQLLAQEKKSGHVLLMIAATAGTTVLGAFDPIGKLADICRREGIWLHVDGAWGGPVIFSKSARQLISDIDRADSFTFDAHKLLGAGLTSSFLLTKHKNLLREANDVSGADYLFHANEGDLDLGKSSWQCGRRADSFSFWCLWKNLGTNGLGDFIDHKFSLRNELITWIAEQHRLELVSSPEYLNICVRILPPPNKQELFTDWSRLTREYLRESNFCLVNYSADARGSFLRLIIAHPQLQLSHLQSILLEALRLE